MPNRIVKTKDESIKLIEGDCLEKMGTIKDGSVDMVLCDLPYGTTQNKWDSVIPLNGLWGNYQRIIKENGVITLFAQCPFDKILGSSNIKLLKYEWIWQKESGTGFLNSKKMPLKDHENILIFYNKQPIYNPVMGSGKPYNIRKSHHGTNYGKDSVDEVVTDNDGSRYPKTVIKFNRDSSKLHPTQKPVALLEYLIKTYTNEGELVLDNCMGSGSTGVACINTGRKFIGIEKDEGYFNIAKERIVNTLKERKV